MCGLTLEIRSADTGWVSTAQIPVAGRQENLRAFPQFEPPRAWRVRVAGVCLVIILAVAVSPILDMRLAFQVYFGVLGLPFAALAVCLLLRPSRLRMVFGEDGIEYLGFVRNVAVPWSDVEWVGWISTLPSPIDPLGYRLAFKVRGQRLPSVMLWIDVPTIAQANGVSPPDVQRVLKHAVEDRGVLFRDRIPDMSPTAMSCCQMAIGAVVFIAVPLLLVTAV